ncbi:unnamed protein product [Closterium sp. Naga37s-1]|nr:unnamed protein product [Closterium sp. Naga37s-1]
MVGAPTVNVYHIYYGSWGAGSGRDVIDAFVQSLSSDSGSQGSAADASVKAWWAISAAYYQSDAGGKKNVSSKLQGEKNVSSKARRTLLTTHSAPPFCVPLLTTHSAPPFCVPLLTTHSAPPFCVPLLTTHSAPPFCVPLLTTHSAPPFCVPLLTTHSAPPFCVPLLTTHSAPPFCVPLLTTHSAPPFCVPLLTTHSAPPFCVPLLTTHSAPPFCVPLLTTHSAPPFCVPLLTTLSAPPFCVLLLTTHSVLLLTTPSALPFVVKSKVGAGKPLALDTQGIYVVLPSADVTLPGFCSQYCGWHTQDSLNSTPLRYAFVGHHGQCPGACGVKSTSPNGKPAIDAIISTLAHELTEAATDPDTNAGWFDDDGEENGDKCARNFGSTKTGSLQDGQSYEYNVVGLNGLKFLVQLNWDRVKSKCVLQNALPADSTGGGGGTPPPPPPPTGGSVKMTCDCNCASASNPMSCQCSCTKTG